MNLSRLLLFVTLSSTAVLGVVMSGQGTPGQGASPPAPAAPAARVRGTIDAGPTQSGLDISGSWRWNSQQDSAYTTANGALADYNGFPLNEAGRLTALAWSASRQTLRQHQCEGYGDPYFYYSPGNYRFWEERDPYTQRLTAMKMWFQTTEVRRTIWMDGRPHPPAYAAHTYPGFSTGQWTGTMLTITTTHLKRAVLRGNGVPISDEATVIERLMRHGDALTVFVTVIDPVFLDAPYTRTIILARNIKLPDAWLYACDDGEQILTREEADVPHYLFGKNPFLREFAEKSEMPLLAAMGGADTLQLPFQSKVRQPAAALDAEEMARTIPSRGPQRTSVAPNPDPNDGEIRVLPVQGSVYMLVGDGGNIAAQVGDQGAFLVDSGAGRLSEKIVAAVARLSPKRIQFIANTSFRADHTGGNTALAAAGEDPSLPGSFFFGQTPRDAVGFFMDIGRSATLMAHNNVQVRMFEARLPMTMIPGDTYLEERRRKYHNGELVEMFYQPNAVTDGDSIIHFRRSDVLAVGDIYDTTRYPVIDIKNGGSIRGEIAALNFILTKTGFEHDEDGGTMIIPGRGRLSDEADLTEYRDMLAIIRDRVQAMIAEGATVEQVKAARLTTDYDTRFGATSGAWTTDMFIEAVYASLRAQ